MQGPPDSDGPKRALGPSLLLALLAGVAAWLLHAAGPLPVPSAAERAGPFDPYDLASLHQGASLDPLAPPRAEADRPGAPPVLAWLLATDPAPPRCAFRLALALHALATAACAWTLLRLGLGVAAATLGALAFGLHPLAVEPLASASLLPRLWSALVVGLAACAWARGGRAATALGVALASLALLAHPGSAGVGAWLLLLERARRRELPAAGGGRARALLAAALLVLGIVLVACTSSPLGGRALFAAQETLALAARALGLLSAGARALPPILSGGGLALALGAWGLWACVLGVSLAVLARAQPSAAALHGALGLGGFLVMVTPSVLTLPDELLARDAAALVGLPALAIAVFGALDRLAASVEGARRALVLGLGGLLCLGSARASLALAPRVRAPRVALAHALGGMEPDQARAARNPLAATRLGEEQLWRGRLTDADGWFRAVLAGDPGHGPALFGRGRVALQRDDRPRALELLSRAREARPEDPRVLERLAEVHIRRSGREEYERAAELLREAVQAEPRFAHAHGRLAALLALLALGADDAHLPEAEASARRALALDPCSREAWKALGETHEKRGELEAAQEAYRRSLACEPDYSEALLRMGRLLREAGRPEEGLAFLEHAYLQHPLESQHAFELARAYADLGRRADAFAHYELTVRANPRHMRANETLGWMLFADGRLAEAGARAEHLLALNPAHLGGRHLAGRVAWARGRYGEARTHLELAARSDPEDAEVGAALALLQAAAPDASLRDGQAARRRAAFLAERTAGRDPAVLHALAAAEAEEGAFAAAVRTAERALELPGTEPEALLGAALRAALAEYRAQRPLRLAGDAEADGRGD